VPKSPTFERRLLRPGGANGLSGLTRARGDRVWAVPEQERVLVQIDARSGRTETTPLAGISGEVDMEAIAWVPPHQFALGTEAARDDRGSDRILIAERRGDTVEVQDSVVWPYGRWNIRASSNHGIEGLCHAEGRLVAALEEPFESDGARVAAVGRYDRATERWSLFRVALTSESGKISALACRGGNGEGAIEVLAVERHFGVSVLIGFELPEGPPHGVIEPRTLVDLAETFQSKANYEGVARLPSGEVALIADNYYGERQGDNALCLLPADATSLGRSQVP
jgi:hypothetical protein